MKNDSQSIPICKMYRPMAYLEMSNRERERDQKKKNKKSYYEKY